MNQEIPDDMPARDILLQYAGVFPLSDDAIFNVIERLIECKDLPPVLACSSGRFAIRTVNAILPELDVAKPEFIGRFCGQRHTIESGLLSQALLAEGIWAGEATPIQLRAFLIDIHTGTHPKDSAKKFGISDTDVLHLEYLLGLEDYWHSEILQRVLVIRSTGGGWLAVAKELRNYNPFILRTWIKLAKDVEQELDFK